MIGIYYDAMSRPLNIETKPLNIDKIGIDLGQYIKVRDSGISVIKI